MYKSGSAASSSTRMKLSDRTLTHGRDGLGTSREHSFGILNETGVYVLPNRKTWYPKASRISSGKKRADE